MNKETKKLIKELKSNRDHKIFITNNSSKLIGYMKPITYYDIGNDDLIENLKNWRNENIFAYLSHDLASFEGTRRWLSKFILDNDSKILFIIYTDQNIPIGHIGLADGLETNSSVEIDNIVRGIKSLIPGIMTHAVYDLISWTFLVTKSKKVYLRVFSDNYNAIKLYEKLRFTNKIKFSLKKEKKNGVTKYSFINSKRITKKYFQSMELQRNDHFLNYNNIKNNK